MNSELIQGDGLFRSPRGVIEIPKLLDGGRFVDYQDLPVLRDQVEDKMDATKLGDDIFQLLSIGVVNWAWQQQNVYIACYPMSADDCKCRLVEPSMTNTHYQPLSTMSFHR